MNTNPLRLFCDTVLTARIERVEAQLIAAASRAARRRHPDARGFLIRVAGGVASFAEHGSPWNKVAGLGFPGVPSTAELDEIERAFADRGAPVQVELAHLADPAIGVALTERGYRLESYENVLGRALADAPGPVTPPGIEVRRSDDDSQSRSCRQPRCRSCWMRSRSASRWACWTRPWGPRWSRPGWCQGWCSRRWRWPCSPEQPPSLLRHEVYCARVLAEEPDLLARLRAGEQAAFVAVVRDWSPAMLRVARAHVRTDASAEEIVQEAWMGVIRGLPGFEGRAMLRTWVFRILINVARRRGRIEARTILELEGPTVDPDRFRDEDDPYPGHWRADAAPSPWDPEPALLSAEFRDVLVHALGELPERQRAVVELRDVHGLDPTEVCELLDLTPANQRVLLHRGRARLRATLEKAIG
ncbi:MAG TPA: sigma-70 family RNA polymerase sigma factor [Actinophytocola sp.]|nr:sigma-70 family RNA polymerase sigma factor [Actinophytocola sp.]